MKKFTPIFALISLFVLVSCALDDKTFDEDGNEVHYIQCGVAVQSVCFSKANEVCPKGYYLVDKSMDTGADDLRNTLTVKCKK